MNLLHHVHTLSAKTRRARHDPDATGDTADALRQMDVTALSEKLIGCTASTTSTNASKKRLRRLNL